MEKSASATEQTIAEQQLDDLAWDIFNGYAEMPPALTDQERATVAAHIEKFKARKADQDKRRAERDKQDAEHVAELLKRLRRNSTENANDTPKPKPTEREARNRCIASMWEYALSPLPDDPTLDAWKREQAIMRALVNGEVLPTTKHQLFNRSECPPLNMEERRQITDAQIVLENLCPKYTDGFRDYADGELTEWIDESERSREAECQRRRDIFRFAHLTEVQDHLFFALQVFYKFSNNSAIKTLIDYETRRVKEEWDAKQNAPDKKIGYAAMADRVQATCDAYVKLLNEIYAMPPTDEVKPDNPPAASIDQNRPTLTEVDWQRLREIVNASAATTNQTIVERTDKLSGEIGVAKKQSRSRQAGLTKENAALKAENAALKR